PRREFRHDLRTTHRRGERRFNLRNSGVWHGVDNRVVVRMEHFDLFAGINPLAAHAHFHGLLSFTTIFIPRWRSSRKNGWTGTATSGGSTPRCAIMPVAIICATIDGGQPVSMSPALACQRRFAFAWQSIVTVFESPRPVT